MTSVEEFLVLLFWLAMKGVFGLWVLWCVIVQTMDWMLVTGAKLDARIDADERRRRGGVVIDG